MNKKRKLNDEDKQFSDLQSLTSIVTLETKITKQNVLEIFEKSGKRNITAPWSAYSYIRRIGRRKRKKDGNENLTNSTGNIIEVQNVTKIYSTGNVLTRVLNNINLEIKAGEIVLILGISGGGKSTLLNLISGLDRPTKGNIIVANKNLPYMSDREITKLRRDKVSFIFQNYNLLENLNAFDNVMTGAWLQKDLSRRLNLTDLFKEYGMSDEINKFPTEMSGGQQQRVSIMRALSKNAEIIFADEPTGALDEQTTRIVLNSLYKANRDWKTTVIMVSHNPAMSAMCHKVVHIEKGNIVRIDINENPLHPDQIGLYNE